MTTQLTTRRAFSLIELMVVILILAVVVAIIVPALGGARNAAKGVSSRATLTQVANAASAFSNDHQERMPGYFTAEEMGDGENDRRGFTEMENVLLELAGGTVERQTGPSMGGSGGDIIEVGPMSGADKTVLVDPTLIGADTTKSGAYFTPDAKLYRTGNGQEGEEDHEKLPDLIDAWGTPVLAWRRNQFGPTRITRDSNGTVQGFARVASSGSASGERAWFYWNANAGFLKGGAVGKLTKSQLEMSMIGGGVGSTERETSLMGFLGSPAYPADLSEGVDVLPGAARGELVLHSAGPSGIFLSKQFAGETIDYFHNFFNAKGDPLTGDGGERETRDLLRAFDDLIQTGN